MKEDKTHSVVSRFEARIRPAWAIKSLRFIHRWAPVLLIGSVLLIANGLMTQVFHTVNVYRDGPTHLYVSQFWDWTLGVCLTIGSGLLMLSSPACSKGRRISLSALSLLIGIHVIYELFNSYNVGESILVALLPVSLQPRSYGGLVELPTKAWHESIALRFILDPTSDLALLIAVGVFVASAFVLYWSVVEPRVEAEQEPRQRGFDVIDPH